jgi:hypothetical protein
MTPQQLRYVCLRCMVGGRIYDGAVPSTHPRWDWVTGIQFPDDPSRENVRGGPIASNVTALVFDDVTGALYIGTPEAMNVMYVNGSIVRMDGLTGLPYANITSLSLQRSSVTDATVLHVGTQAGLISIDVTPEAGSPTTPLPFNRWSFSYRYLQRWAPGPFDFVDPCTGLCPPPCIVVVSSATQCSCLHSL